MRKPRMRFLTVGIAGILSISLLGACGSPPSNDGESTGSGAASKDVTIGMAAGWDEDIAVSHLWKYALQKKGYNVKLTELDVGPVFVGVAKGDIDLFLDTWLPVTHEDYWKQYKDQVVDLGVWYDQATLNIAVPDYVKADSIEDLKAMEKEMGGTIVGIDAGAGLTRVTKDNAIPQYGLSGYNLKTSSTPAMLAALKKATDAKEPIVVTLWHPHWAYSAFPIKDLKDTKGAMGAAEQIHSISSQKFAKNNPEVTNAIKNFKMDDKTLGDLEKVVLQDNKDNIDKGIEQWAAANQTFVDNMMK